MLYLSACSTTNSKKNTFTPQIAASNQVVIYIYRPSVMSNAIYSPDLYINNEFKLSIKNGKHSRLSLMPGEYKFELEPDKNYAGSTSLSLNLNTGTTYFIRVDTSLKIESATSYKPYQRSFNLIKIDEKLAVNEIAKCCVIKSKKITPSEINTIIKEPDDGFSVDKTQNPFSH